MLGLAELQYSTAHLRPDEQFEVWGQVVDSVFAAASLRRLEGASSPSFASACQARRIGDLTLAWIHASPHAVTRSAQHVRRIPGEVYFLNLTMRGQATSAQGGRQTPTSPGELVIIDSDRPFELAFGTEFEQLCLTIPKALIDHRLASPEIATALTLCTQSAAGAVVASALRALADQRKAVTAREALAVSESIAALVATAVSEATLIGSDSHRELLTQGIIDEIERSLPDVDLTPAVVARRVSISVSYLTKLLHCRGTTFGHLLLERRLERAWALLDPACGDGRTVTAIAASCGFRDSAHFARTFRARFGCTPTQRRSSGDHRPGVSPRPSPAAPR